MNLREFDLARRANLSVQQVIEGLKQLEAEGILHYQPQSDLPRVTYLQPRQQNRELAINKRYIEERKATYRQKMEAVFAYAEHRRCRSQMLLAYFDESAPKCGVCDICLEEKRQKNRSEITDDIVTSIVQLLSAGELSLEKLITHLSAGTEKERIETIRLLLDAGKIKTDGERYFLIKS